METEFLAELKTGSREKEAAGDGAGTSSGTASAKGIVGVEKAEINTGMAEGEFVE